MNRIFYALAIVCIMLAIGCSSTRSSSNPEASVQNKKALRIAFGSCAKEDKPQPIWQAINDQEPDLFIFLGDNIYADTTDPEVIRAKYQLLAGKSGFQQLKKNTQVLGIWDDHDYGQNDAGEENPIKTQARELMLDFFNEPEDSKRRFQKGGIYTSYYIGEGDNRVQILLPDLRWNRTPLKTVSPDEYKNREARNMGPYLPDDSTGAQMLGAAQWQWLEAELQQPAAVRIIASSLQLLPEFTGWEAWANFPRERQRLLELLKQHGIDNLFIVSGDTHWSEFSEFSGDLPAPLFEATSSGLTEKWKQISPNRHRISEAFAEPNFGVIDIDWAAHPVALTFRIHDERGALLLQHTRYLKPAH